MYRRYEPSPRRSRQAAPGQESHRQTQGNNAAGNRQGSPQHRTGQGSSNNNGSVSQKNSPPTEHKPRTNTPRSVTNPITRFIPQSLYNAETGKVLGFMNAEDLFIAALIILLIDSGCDDGDNTMLILALLYLLLSEHIDLPI